MKRTRSSWLALGFLAGCGGDPSGGDAEVVTQTSDTGDAGDADTVDTVDTDATDTGPLDSAAGDAEVGAEVACQDVCTVDETHCNGNALSTCVRGANGCLAWGPSVACDAGELCSDGACHAQCSDDCLADGLAVCDGQGVKRCGHWDVDACLEWNTPEACTGGTSCVNGACTIACQDDCVSSGTQVCDGDGYRTCGAFDADACLDLSSRVACPGGTTCSGGTCQVACTNECTSGQVVCDGARAVRTCGNFDGDACTDLGPATPCSGDDVCAGGACGPACPGACTPGTRSCVGSNGSKVCVAGEGCPAPGVFASCQLGNTCSDGACGGGCTVPELLLLVDRSSSTSGAVFEFLRSAVDAFLVETSDRVMLSMVAFPGGDSGCTPGGLVGPYLGDRKSFGSVLTAPAATAATAIAAALAGNTIAFGDPNQGEAVVLVTDGSETCGAEADALTAVATYRARGIRVYAIGVGSGFNQPFLESIAVAGGTEHARAATDRAGLLEALRAIVVAEGASCVRRDGNTTNVCESGVCSPHCAPGSVACGESCCPTPNTVAFCRIQYPTDDVVIQGAVLPEVYGVLYEPGATGEGSDASQLRVELGVGDLGTSPLTQAPNVWRWASATFNTYADNGFGEMKNSEYKATLPSRNNGTYNWAWRVSKDSGTTWSYCDEAGNAVVDPAATGVVIYDR